MRGVRRLPRLVTIAGAVALAAPVAGSAHLSADPAFLSVGAAQRLELTVHNDRDAPMTGFRLTAPAGFTIRDPGGEEGWDAVVAASSATWSGGSLEPFEPVTFELDLEAAGIEPGAATLQGDQLYEDGETVSWPVALTVLPFGTTVGETETDPLGGTAIAILSILGVLVLATFGLVLYQRRRRPLQEE
jgi:hypothetical protein